MRVVMTQPELVEKCMEICQQLMETQFETFGDTELEDFINEFEGGEDDGAD